MGVPYDSNWPCSESRYLIILGALEILDIHQNIYIYQPNSGSPQFSPSKILYHTVVAALT